MAQNYNESFDKDKGYDQLVHAKSSPVSNSLICSGCILALGKVGKFKELHEKEVESSVGTIISLIKSNTMLEEQLTDLESEVAAFNQDMYQKIYRSVCADLTSLIYLKLYLTIDNVYPDRFEDFHHFARLHKIEQAKKKSYELHDILDKALVDIGLTPQEYNIMKDLKDTRNIGSHKDMSVDAAIEYLMDKQLPADPVYGTVRSALLRSKQILLEMEKIYSI